MTGHAEHHHVAATVDHSAHAVESSTRTRHEHGHDHAAMMSDPAMAKAMEKDMARRFWVALILTVPVIIITGHVPGMRMLVMPPLSNWIALALSTPVVFWCGWIFLAGTVAALQTRKLDMSVLIATGVLAAYVSSVYLTIIGLQQVGKFAERLVAVLMRICTNRIKIDEQRNGANVA